MNSLSASQPSDFGIFKTYIEAFGGHPNYVKINGKPLVTTFGGEYSKFGTKTATEGWQGLLSQIPPVINFLYDIHSLIITVTQIHFVPTFFEMMVDHSLVDGDCNVGSMLD